MKQRKPNKWDRRKARQKYLNAACRAYFDRRHRATKMAEASIRWDVSMGLSGIRRLVNKHI